MLENDFLLKNNGSTNRICLCVFYTCCILDFNQLRGFGNLSSNLLLLLIWWSMFSKVNIVIRCMASYLITEKCVCNTPNNDLIVPEKCYFVLEKSWHFISDKVWEPCVMNMYISISHECIPIIVGRRICFWRPKHFMSHVKSHLPLVTPSRQMKTAAVVFIRHVDRP